LKTINGLRRGRRLRARVCDYVSLVITHWYDAYSWSNNYVPHTRTIRESLVFRVMCMYIQDSSYFNEERKEGKNCSTSFNLTFKPRRDYALPQGSTQSQTSNHHPSRPNQYPGAPDAPPRNAHHERPRLQKTLTARH
jgi:hypothetical protein